MLRGDDESLAPRPRALAQLAATLTAQPWAITPEIVADARRQGLNEEQIEAAVTVISMFNYFTRVADATGIELDYLTPLPTFEPDRHQAVKPRPARLVSADRDVAGSPPLRHPPLRAAWQSWRAYVLESDGPLSRRERRLLASVAAEEAGDWDGGTASSAPGSDAHDGQLAEFARKLSCQPWLMGAEDIEGLRACGYSETAVLHIISVVAHQNADSRLAAGLAAASRT